MAEAPLGLHSLEYARHILDSVLGWPAKGNLELMADCLTAIQTSRKLSTAWHAHKYMLRAIELAKHQGLVIDRMWFMNGEYTNMRPPRTARQYEPIDAERTRQEQSTPEWEQASITARIALANLAGKRFESVTNTKEKLREQAAEIQRRSQSDSTQQEGKAALGNSQTS